MLAAIVKDQEQLVAKKNNRIKQSEKKAAISSAKYAKGFQNKNIWQKKI